MFHRRPEHLQINTEGNLIEFRPWNIPFRERPICECGRNDNAVAKFVLEFFTLNDIRVDGSVWDVPSFILFAQNIVLISDMRGPSITNCQRSESGFRLLV